MQDPKPAPQVRKKKKKKKGKKVGQIKAVGEGLEGFVDWVDPIVSELTEEREDDMSNLTVGFFARMCKWAISAKGETTLGSEVPGDKSMKRSGPYEVAQKSPTVITMDSLE